MAKKLIAVMAGDQQRRQRGDRLAHQDGDRHLGHEGHGHTEDDGSGAIARGENARGVKQLVADDLGDEDGAVGGEEDREHREIPISYCRDTVAQQAVELVDESVALENVAREGSRTRSGYR